MWDVECGMLKRGKGREWRWDGMGWDVMEMVKGVAKPPITGASRS